MQTYQLDYIKNCADFRSLTALPRFDCGSFDTEFGNTMENMRKATTLSRRNTALLNEYLMPVLNNLYGQPDDTLAELEAFADKLSEPPDPLDIALADQIFTALLSVARHSKSVPCLTRLLYKSGMAKHKMYDLFTALDYPEVRAMSNRMRQLFTEAASYATPFERFDGFDPETKDYILRSYANTYLGRYDDWHDRLACVRRTMKLFNDPRYRNSAPNVPWDKFIDTVHRQMVSVLPHRYPEGTIPPETIADVMDSAYFIYQSRHESSRRDGDKPETKRIIPYFNVQMSCGIITLQELLAELENNMNAANVNEYDSDTMYRVLSLPAFYIQDLIKNEKMLKKRKDYVISLYERAVNYIERMPDDKVTETARLYARQLMMIFEEFDSGVTYKEFILTVMSRFTPELYAHGYTVGRETAEIADALFSQKRDAFDDIPYIAEITDTSEKRGAIRELAMDAGLLHDAGKIGLATLYNHAGRQLLRSEEIIMRVHSRIGEKHLRARKSTERFASAALGHHRWFDCSGGYPDTYNRNEDNYRVLVDIIALTDFLDVERCDNAMLPIRTTPFEEKACWAKELSGTRFSPEIMGLLDDTELWEKLKYIYDNGRREGYYKCAMNKNTITDASRSK